MDMETQLSFVRRTPFSEPIPSRLKWGAFFVAAAGLIPFTVGTYIFTSFVFSMVEPELAWRAMFFNFGGTESFSYVELKQFNPQAAEVLSTNTHIAAVNLMFSGLTVSLLGFFEFPARSKLAWYLAVGLSFWVGGNDLLAGIIAQKPPVPAVPGILAVTGLLLAHRPIFDKKNHTRHAW